MSKVKKRFLIASISILSILIIVASAFFIYTAIYYHADNTAVNAYISAKPAIHNDKLSNALAVYSDEWKAGIVFYPGGKVEYTAYSPLMYALAERGYYCILVKMPLNLAIFKPNAANNFIGSNDIAHWYIAGHSLGGSMAAKCASSNAEKLDGLILLGAYSINDLSSTSLKALSIYGSEDMVLNKSKYDKNRSNLPTDFTEYVIEGGCHAYYGMYGAQKGDGTPAISNIEQIEMTADIIAEFIGL